MNSEFFKRIVSSIILIPITLFFLIKGGFFFNIFVIICFFITTYEWHNMSKNKSYNIYGILFLILSFYSIYLLRNSFEETYIYLLLVILICSLTDIGGYFFGKIFKGPKLTKISPKKTYSGMVGGYLLPIIFFYLILVFTDLFAKLEVSTSLFLFVFLISTTNQLGDILISFFKRVSKIKDTGKIIPGHGGLLDRIDGMIFAFPISYIIFLIENFTWNKK